CVDLEATCGDLMPGEPSRGLVVTPGEMETIELEWRVTDNDKYQPGEVVAAGSGLLRCHGKVGMRRAWTSSRVGVPESQAVQPFSKQAITLLLDGLEIQSYAGIASPSRYGVRDLINPHQGAIDVPSKQLTCCLGGFKTMLY